MQSSALSQVINSGETEVTVPLPVQSSPVVLPTPSAGAAEYLELVNEPHSLRPRTAAQCLIGEGWYLIWKTTSLQTRDLRWRSRNSYWLLELKASIKLCQARIRKLTRSIAKAVRIIDYRRD
jgi:hypothetical protein